MHVLAERLLAPIAEAKVDTLLLGCTHYPYLARTIIDVLGRDVVLVSSADETAFELRALLEGGEGLDGVRSPPVRVGTSSCRRATSICSAVSERGCSVRSWPNVKHTPWD